MRFTGVLTDVIDGDSVFVGSRKVRVSGVDVPSSGIKATGAKTYIRSEWIGHRVTVDERCCGRPHDEIPGVVTDEQNRSLGEELWHRGFARRDMRYKID